MFDQDKKKQASDRALLQVFVSPVLKLKIENAAKKDGLTLAAFLRRLLTRKFSG